MNRRLPVYIVVDCSESMVGEPLDAVKRGLKQLQTDLMADPMAIETACVSVITFATRAKQAVPLTEVLSFRPPPVSVAPGTSLGAALELLGRCIKKEVRKGTATQKGDWKPVVFLLTDGVPTDNWRAALDSFRKQTRGSVVNVIAVGCGADVDSSVLKEVTPNVVLMRDITSGSLGEFFKWVSSSVSTASVSVGQEGEGVRLPGLPSSAEFVSDEAARRTAAPGAPSQIILAARCSEGKGGYLMRYCRADEAGNSYEPENAYQVGEDYFNEAAATPSGKGIDASKLKGAPACPYCGRPGWRLSDDRMTLVCSDSLEVGGGGAAQVMFVLDVTGSMAGEISGVKDGIKDFIDFIQSEGLDVQVGLIAFRDLSRGPMKQPEPPEILMFGGRPFTKDADSFKRQVSRLRANGGGRNIGESSFDALVLATRQRFEEGNTRILILITDEPPLLPDGDVKTLDDVFSAITRASIDQLHIVVPPILYPLYKLLHTHVAGELFPLDQGGRSSSAFRSILMNVGKRITVMTRLG